jgi:hypothetical protein
MQNEEIQSTNAASSPRFRRIPRSAFRIPHFPMNDLRFALRQLRKNPLTAVAVLCSPSASGRYGILASDAVLLKMLPVRDRAIAALIARWRSKRQRLQYPVRAARDENRFH